MGPGSFALSTAVLTEIVGQSDSVLENFKIDLNSREGVGRTVWYTFVAKNQLGKRKVTLANLDDFTGPIEIMSGKQHFICGDSY